MSSRLQTSNSDAREERDSGAAPRLEGDTSELRHGLVPLAKITVCMIVFNEEEVIDRALQALKPWFSSFVILDMGSIDNTRRIIQQTLGDQARIEHFPRERLLEIGYAEARNVCASFAETDWILAVDADEILVSGIEADGIWIDCPVAEASLAAVERRNLLKEGGARPSEFHYRLYRNDGTISWTGYIHEELARSGERQKAAVVKSRLLFDHLSEVRSDLRINNKRDMYHWMLLHAYFAPSIRGGTNRWWYDEYVPQNMEMIAAGAQQYLSELNEFNVFGFSDSTKKDRTVVPQNPGRTNTIRQTIIEKLWGGGDPLKQLPDKLYAPDPQGWNSDHRYLFEAVTQRSPGIIVEIGVWKGGSTITMAKEMRRLGLSGTVISVDTWLGSWDHWCQPQWRGELCFAAGWPHLYYKFLTNVLAAEVADHVVPLPLDSGNASFVLRELGIAADVIHLDAAHDYAAVMRDLEAWWRVLRPGGLFIGDDYFVDGKTWTEVRAATDEFLSRVPHSDFEHENGKWRALKIS